MWSPQRRSRACISTFIRAARVHICMCLTPMLGIAIAAAIAVIREHVAGLSPEEALRPVREAFAACGLLYVTTVALMCVHMGARAVFVVKWIASIF